MSEANRHKVVKVELLWSENVLYQRLYGGIEPSPPPSFKSLWDASCMLRRMSFECPKLGYDKTKFRVTWDDGYEYEGRYDLHNHEKKQENPNGYCDLADHVRYFVKFVTGDHKPHWMDEEKYRQVLKFYGTTEESRQQARDFLANYDID